MAYLSIQDFKFGLDRRRKRVAGVPGTLWLGVNVHISRGGDIERAKKFVPTYTLPAGTFGLATIRSQLFTFGSADLAASMPVGVQYQRLQAPSTPAMTKVIWSNAFDGKLYVIAEYADGNIHHFYDGTRVDELDALSDANSSYSTLADYLARKVNADPAVSATSVGSTIVITSTTPGTAFTIGTTPTDVGGTNDQTAAVTQVQANVVEVDEVRATATLTVTAGSAGTGNTITSVMAGAVELLNETVDWSTSNESTAARLVAEINTHAGTSNFTASADGAVITVQAAPGTGATLNGTILTATVGGTVSANTTNFAGGVTYVAPVAQIESVALGGTYEATDRFTITINGTGYVATGRASGHGTSAFVHKKREWLTANSLFRYCKLNDPTDWTDATASTGAGFINMSNDSEGTERLVASATYQTSVVIFARKSVRVYTLSTDATVNSFVQSIDNTGAIAPRSVLAYGNTDVFFLDETGIRSLKARDASNAAYVSDAGSAIDPFVQEWIASLSDATVEDACGVIEPTEGRYWLAIGERIYVLSYFPASKVNAWTHYEPGFTTTAFARLDRRVFARDATTIYCYGGLTGDIYPDADETPATVELPFMSAQKPATFKKWEGFDMACTGQWDVDLLCDPNDEDVVVNVGVITRTTYGLPHIKAVGEFPLFAMKLVASGAGEATISNMAFHYEATEAE